MLFHNWDNSPDTIINKTPHTFLYTIINHRFGQGGRALLEQRLLTKPELAYVDVELLTIVLLEYTTPPPLFLPTQ